MPYNPQAVDQRGNFIMQGNEMSHTNALALGSWLENFLNQQKQINNAGKSADYFVKSNQNGDGSNPILEEMGIHQDEWANLGARDKSAAVQGLLQSRAAKQQAADIQAQTDLRNAQAAKAQTDAAAEGALGPIMQRATELMRGGSAPAQLPLGAADWGALLGGQGPRAFVQTPGTATAGMALPQALLQAIGESKAMNPRVQGALISKILPQMIQNAGGEGDSTPIEMTMSDGTKVLYQPHTKNPAMFSPSSKAEATAAAQQAVLQTKADLHQKLIANGFTPAKNAQTGEDIADVYTDATGKTVDLRSGITKLTGQPPNAPAPVPKNKADLKKGQDYQLAQGVYTWDGSQFTKKK
jgi:hypothetical protein